MDTADPVAAHEESNATPRLRRRRRSARLSLTSREGMSAESEADVENRQWTRNMENENWKTDATMGDNSATA